MHSLRFIIWLGYCLDVYVWMIILRIIISGITPYPQSSWLRLANAITDPGYVLLEKFIPPMIIFGRYFTDEIILAVLVIFLGLKYLFFLIIPSSYEN